MKILAIYGASALWREVLSLAEIINEKRALWDEFIVIDDNKLLVEIKTFGKICCEIIFILPIQLLASKVLAML